MCFTAFFPRATFHNVGIRLRAKMRRNDLTNLECIYYLIFLFINYLEFGFLSSRLTTDLNRVD